MVEVLFYEKPGCANNRRQRELLLAQGHRLIVRDLLTASWTAETLLPFLRPRAVSSWFNRSSPRVKSGEVVPEVLDEAQALRLLLEDPLLIRRPLVQVGEWRSCGFEPEALDFLLSTGGEEDERHPSAFPKEGCQRGEACPSPPTRSDS